MVGKVITMWTKLNEGRDFQLISVTRMQHKVDRRHEGILMCCHFQFQQDRKRAIHIHCDTV